jgi:hypothetical protein
MVASVHRTVTYRPYHLLLLIHDFCGIFFLVFIRLECLHFLKFFILMSKKAFLLVFLRTLWLGSQCTNPLLFFSQTIYLLQQIITLLFSDFYPIQFFLKFRYLFISCRQLWFKFTNSFSLLLKLFFVTLAIVLLHFASLDYLVTATTFHISQWAIF